MLLFTDVEDKVLVFSIQAYATHVESLDETSPKPTTQAVNTQTMTVSFQQQYFTGFYPPGLRPKRCW